MTKPIKRTLTDKNLIDDILFTILMQNEEFCIKVLSIILNKELTEVKYSQIQRTYQNLPGYKSIHLLDIIHYY